MNVMERYIVAIDQSTSASKVFLIDAQGEITRQYSREHQQFYPKAGYVEHDADEIWRNVADGIIKVTQRLMPAQLAALSICNQRETTVIWERATGRPLCHAIVWQDVRGEALCDELKEHAEYVRSKTGLALSAYYSAAKAASVLRENPKLRHRAEAGEVCIGTVDSYLIYRLTSGRAFATDVSNASRTQLCDIRALAWDDGLCKLFGIPSTCLPEIRPSDAIYGKISYQGLPCGISITGVMGDSHAALFGHGCHKAGMAKATFGTGSSVMLNVGEAVIASSNGLSSSVGFGFRGSTCYVLEGNVTCSGDTLCWLRDEAGMIDDINEVEALAASVKDTDGVFFIPAFSGLGAPYFDGRARAALLNMNRSTTRAHIVRAALESIVYQDVDILLAMARDAGRLPSAINADGGPSRNRLLMQRLADLAGIPVRRSATLELSALGTAYMAGLAVGMFSNFDTIPSVGRQGESYQPSLDDTARGEQMAQWYAAVARCR